MAAHLRAHGVDAVASHYYFTRYTKEERPRFEKAIADSGADSFLLTRVTTTERRSRDVPDVILGPGNVPSNSSLDIYGAFLVYGGAGQVMAQADFTPTTMNTEASLYTGQSRKLVWTARTKPRNAGPFRDRPHHSPMPRISECCNDRCLPAPRPVHPRPAGIIVEFAGIAGVVQWQNGSFPSCIRGFDPLHPLQVVNRAHDPPLVRRCSRARAGVRLGLPPAAAPGAGGETCAHRAGGRNHRRHHARCDP